MNACEEITVRMGSRPGGSGDRGARVIFTPCAEGPSLLKKFNLAATTAALGDVILRSSACSGWIQHRDQKDRGELSVRKTPGLADAIGGGLSDGRHNGQQAGKKCREKTILREKHFYNLPRVFLRRNPGAKHQTKPHPERTLTSVKAL